MTYNSIVSGIVKLQEKLQKYAEKQKVKAAQYKDRINDLECDVAYSYSEAEKATTTAENLGKILG